MNIKKIVLPIVGAAIACGMVFAVSNHAKKCCCGKAPKQIIVAYVASGSDMMPDPFVMTHINYAFGHVTKTFDGVTIHNPERLKKIVELKKQNKDLKVVLSIGGWGSGNFSEMAADPKLRKKFAADCARVIKEFNLDGVDIDWEYPTAGKGAGISTSPQDTENYTLMMRDIRKAIGPKKLLTLATVWSAKYIDFKGIDPYINYVNIMSYDMTPASKGYPHNPLYSSAKAGERTTDNAYKAHLAAGVPPHKLVIGLPFYGRGIPPYPDYMDYKDMKYLPGTKAVWDDEAHSTYMVDEATGKVLMGFETPKSLAEKLHYIKESGCLGAMYWEYTAGGHEPAKQVADSILNRCCK